MKWHESGSKDSKKLRNLSTEGHRGQVRGGGASKNKLEAGRSYMASDIFKKLPEASCN